MSLLDTSQTMTKKITFEHKATLNLFSWKIQVYGRKVKTQKRLDEIDLACINMEKQMSSSNRLDARYVVDALR